MPFHNDTIPNKLLNLMNHLSGLETLCLSLKPLEVGEAWQHKWRGRTYTWQYMKLADVCLIIQPCNRATCTPLDSHQHFLMRLLRVWMSSLPRRVHEMVGSTTNHPTRPLILLTRLFFPRQTWFNLGYFHKLWLKVVSQRGFGGDWESLWNERRRCVRVRVRVWCGHPRTCEESIMTV